MSQLLITKADIRKAVVQYFHDYAFELYERYDFDTIDWYVDDKKANLNRIEAVVEEKS